MENADVAVSVEVVFEVSACRQLLLYFFDYIGVWNALLYVQHVVYYQALVGLYVLLHDSANVVFPITLEILFTENVKWNFLDGITDHNFAVFFEIVL